MRAKESQVENVWSSVNHIYCKSFVVNHKMLKEKAQNRKGTSQLNLVASQFLKKPQKSPYEPILNNLFLFLTLTNTLIYPAIYIVLCVCCVCVCVRACVCVPACLILILSLHLLAT